MMAGVGIGVDALQRATPIISGFLLGYIAVLPLIGRLSDLLDRRRILLGCLIVFVVGSAVTALAVEMPRPRRRAACCRASAAAGSCRRRSRSSPTSGQPTVAAPRSASSGRCRSSARCSARCSGAVILAWSGWRAIFWANVIAGLLLYAVIRLLGSRSLPAPPAPPRRVCRRAPQTGRPGLDSTRDDGGDRGCSASAWGARTRRARGVRHGRDARARLRALRRRVAAAHADRDRRPAAHPRARCRHRSTLVGGAAPRRSPRGAPRRHRARQSRPDLRLVRSREGGGRPLRLSRCCRSGPLRWRSSSGGMDTRPTP